MTESNHPEPLPYRPLAPSGRRAVASTSLYTAALGEVELLAASTLVDVLDGVSWARIRTERRDRRGRSLRSLGHRVTLHPAAA